MLGYLDITLGLHADVPLTARFTQGEVLGFAQYVLRLAVAHPAQLRDCDTPVRVV